MSWVRIKKAAEILKISVTTLRVWSNEGKIEYALSAAGQRVYNEEYLHSLINPETTVTHKIFYTRSSGGKDTSLKTQEQKLTKAYGQPTKIYTDKASGLNENRKGLKALINHCKEHPSTIYITNKDRLTRFGYTYLEQLLHAYNTTITILDDDTTKEPHEILLQDFMSLLASFSGKYYRLRGWAQQEQFLNNITQELNTRKTP